MKTNRILHVSLMALMALSIVSCRGSKSKDETVIISGKRPAASSTSATTGHLPPGQAKKLNGDQSAKAYAPGQQKKKGKKKKG